jgi:hypothetical protein
MIADGAEEVEAEVEAEAAGARDDAITSLEREPANLETTAGSSM